MVEIRHAESARVRLEPDGPWFTLRPQCVRFLEFMLAHEGEAVPFAEIADACHIEGLTLEHKKTSIRALVNKLRDQTGQNLVVPVWGYGYVLPKARRL